MIPKICSECGRPALVLVHHGKKRSRTARKGQPVVIKHHDLCKACYQALVEKLRPHPDQPQR